MKKTCKIAGCQSKYHCKEYCQKHYLRHKKYGDPNFLIRTRGGQQKKCSVEGCEKLSKARGVCRNHYQNWRSTAIASTDKEMCSVNGCKRLKYANRLCKPHYELKRRKGSTEYTFVRQDYCSVPGCLFKGPIRNGYCPAHRARLKRGVELDTPRNWGNSGSNNHWWKGGVAEYPNHSLMKRIRKQKIKEVGGFCQICHKPANTIHHLDHNKSNHDPSNIIVVCTKCHFKVFHSKPHTSKYRREYGYTFNEIRKIIKKDAYVIKALHIDGKLKDVLSRRYKQKPTFLYPEKRIVTQDSSNQ